jgi:hypothetical protein
MAEFVERNNRTWLPAPGALDETDWIIRGVATATYATRHSATGLRYQSRALSRARPLHTPADLWAVLNPIWILTRRLLCLMRLMMALGDRL